eukprot:scaffold16.g156.t1
MEPGPPPGLEGLARGQQNRRGSGRSGGAAYPPPSLEESHVASGRTPYAGSAGPPPPTAGKRRALFSEHLRGADLQRGLKTGALFRAVLRVAASDRTQAYCTVPGLPTDIFIKGALQNRAVDGDEVAVRILAPAAWWQSSKGGPGSSPRGPGQPAPGPRTAPACEAAATEAAPRSNILPLPAGLLGRGKGAVAGEVAMAALKEEASPHRPAGDLVASPALQRSASGGEPGFALGPTGLLPKDRAARKGTGSAAAAVACAEADDEEQTEEEEEEEALSESLTDEEREALLAELEEEEQEGGAGQSMPVLVESLRALALEEEQGAAPGSAAAAGEAAEVAAPAGAETPAAPPPGAPPQPDGSEERQVEALQEPGEEDEKQEEPQAESMLDFVLSSSIGAAATPPPAGRPPPTPGTGAAAPAAEDSVLRPWYLARAEAEAASHGSSLASGGPATAVAAAAAMVASELAQRDGWRATAEVVAVLEPSRRRETVVGVLKQASNLESWARTAQEGNAVFLVPADPRLPRMIVRRDGLPFQLQQSLLAEAQEVRASIGQAGALATETAALLAMEQVDEELARRRDFRGARVFSIDPPTARDLDDALSIQKLDSGLYRMDKQTLREACTRTPGAGVDRLAFSIVWDMTEEGDIKDQWVGRSVIRSCGKLAYPMVQAMIEGAYLAEEGQEPPCELHGPHTWPEVVADSLALQHIAANLRRRRFEGGALRLDNTRLYFSLDDDGNPSSCSIYEQACLFGSVCWSIHAGGGKEANQLVEEFMLLANMSAARLAASAWPGRALLRCHPPPSAHKLAEVAATAAELGYELDIESAGALQQSLAALRALPGVDAAALEVARYFSTGEAPDEAAWRHYALAVSHYTHFTSPIRRYPDIIVHRLLAAAIDSQGGEKARAKRHGLADGEIVGRISSHANDRKAAAKSVQDGCLRLYLCVMLHRQPVVVDAVVMQLGGSRFFDCYIPVFGCDVRVHTETLLGGGASAVLSQWEANTRTLVLGHAAGAASGSTAAQEQQRGGGRALRAPPAAASPLPAGGAAAAAAAAALSPSPSSAAAAPDQPDYSDVPNFERLSNPAGLAPMRLPLTLRLLTHVTLVVSSRRGATSGSPTHVFAKLWLES